jgi:hypothetical protein
VVVGGWVDVVVVVVVVVGGWVDVVAVVVLIGGWVVVVVVVGNGVGASSVRSGAGSAAAVEVVSPAANAAAATRAEAVDGTATSGAEVSMGAVPLPVENAANPISATNATIVRPAYAIGARGRNSAFLCPRPAPSVSGRPGERREGSRLAASRRLPYHYRTPGPGVGLGSGRVSRRETAGDG